MRARRLLIVGAGPVGLAAALGCARRGMEAFVLEREAVGATLRRWGPTRLFSPMSMNLASGAAELLPARWPPDAILTGPQFADDVLEPLAASPPLAGRVLLRHRVAGVARAGITRGDFAGHPLRAERPFRLLVETPEGERWMEADAVLDASGTYSQPVAVGSGGLPAPGEGALASRIVRDLGTLADRRPALAGRRVLLAGHGHSAANAILVLEELAREAPATRVLWAVRTANLRPCVEVASDPLPERQRVVSRANQLAARPPEWLQVERRASVESLTAAADGTIRVGLSAGHTAPVDHLVSLTGYRPDLSFLSELALEISPSSEGAARLTAALSRVTDCLSVPAVSAADLASGEPGFHLIGAKSYGRARTFLLKSGYAQLETILDGLTA
ncbi:MAG TPA: NAD(P)-binding domain-containing protein [Myxococcaceae bacterium]|nr:NAD(P)-binding domain-containing protein [Myxococcaceae bacterium]